MSERPFMQLYVSDYLGDTRHLSCEQHGAYLLLLMTMWNAAGSLPDDDAKLARIVCLSVKKWRSIRDDIIPFFSIEDGQITHGRLAKELQKSESKSHSRATAGAGGGKAKALKDKEVRLANASVLPQHLPDTITIQKEDANASKTRATKADFETWYWHYPHKVQRGAAEKAFFKARHFASIEELVAGVQRYVASKPPDRQWQNPATWLNGKGWLDAPAQVSHSPPPGKRMNAVEANLARRIRKDESTSGRRDYGDVQLLPPDRPGLPDFAGDVGKALTWDG